MSIKKILVCLLTVFLFSGCQKVEYEESKEPFTVQIFFSQSCPHCKQLRKDFVDRLKNDFNDQVSFVEYDIDLEESIELYDTYIGLYDSEKEVWDKVGLLEDVETHLADYSRYIPFVVVGDMYAFMGYEEELLDAYVQDVHLALQGRKLATGDVSHGRWLFRKNEE